MPGERLYTSRPHAIWIDRLSVAGDRLTVVVADGSKRAALTFDLSAVRDERQSDGE